jgi:peptidoglycan-N-acetylglucosamine deacetylase
MMIMKTRNIILFVGVSMVAAMGNAQAQKLWGGKQCAVVLTYDDALDVHLDKAIPGLDSVGFKGTFYLSAAMPGFTGRMEDWRKAARKGHEMANHSMFHPCAGDQPGRTWVSADYDLAHYSVRRMTDEIRMNNVVLHLLDGKTKRTFAYPCGDMTAGGVSYVDSIRNEFVAARGTKSEIITNIKGMDFFNVSSYVVSQHTGDALIQVVKDTMKQKGLIVFMFHGVGGGHNINVDLKAHQQLLHFLKQNEKSVQVTTFIDVVEQIARYNTGK